MLSAEPMMQYSVSKTIPLLETSYVCLPHIMEVTQQRIQFKNATEASTQVRSGHIEQSSLVTKYNSHPSPIDVKLPPISALISNAYVNRYSCFGNDSRCDTFHKDEAALLTPSYVDANQKSSGVSFQKKNIGLPFDVISNNVRDTIQDLYRDVLEKELPKVAETKNQVLFSSAKPIMDLNGQSNTSPHRNSSKINSPGKAILKAKVRLRKQCSVCGKVCSRPSTLKTHFLIHTGDTPFKCSWEGCHKAFNVKSNMLRHMKSHERRRNKKTCLAK
ncbi:uncharacterized protein NDAI_0B02080 [Naumovozyma dairenensis CBS 421]|uniref:C2H2-type domain-containing protein n=1 Tax=Naumovozyma dairenensis (strain ATCC 10597 / BCRC 20456 / CBS 421 / NBRC 0211 / NRRL Y-12639) TaxID=1071378 RepID=G0W632_NAUDC|nr:hypothetical protein NDAI_0B02080 [Naumovozyma dairenensis CBS 421]CCD23243.1 hypothetical protein NDAI_0B02080 [Naumovozyma dairenensis CBS 421]